MTPRCLAAALALVLGACPAGCLGVSRQTELLETELRQQEDSLYSIRSELRARDADLAAARREIELLRAERTTAAHTAMPAEHAVVVTRATGVRFHSLLTRALDRGERPGDDVLNIVFTPHDSDGETVKLPGALRFELLDLARPEGERIVAAWDFPPEKVREHWHSGFIASGYRFELPLPQTVHSSRLTLLGRLTTHDGRRFDATHAINVRLAADQGRLVEGPGGVNGPDEAAVPVSIEQMSLPPAGSGGAGVGGAVAGGEGPAFELPRFDSADQKATDLSQPAPVLAPGLEEGIRPIPGFEPAEPRRPAAEPAPFPLPPEHWNPTETSPAPAMIPAAWDSPGTTRLVPLPNLERSDRKPEGVQPNAVPLHRLGAPPLDGYRPRRLYHAAGLPGYAPITVILPPSDMGATKPDVRPGTARVWDW